MVTNSYIYNTLNAELKKSLRALPEKIISNYLGFMQRSSSLLLDVLNKKIVQQVESGLAEHYVSRNMPKKHPDEELGPQVLSFDEMSAGFVIWLTCLLVAFTSLLIEILMKQLTKICTSN